MQPSKLVRALLFVSGLVAVVIGATILLAPESLHASYGTELGAAPSLLSEIRAPGGALLAAGLLVLAGAFVTRLSFAALAVAATVYLSYGLSRLVSMALDGVPDSGLVAATVIELVLGGAAALAWTRSAPRPSREPLASRPRARGAADRCGRFGLESTPS